MGELANNIKDDEEDNAIFLFFVQPEEDDQDELGSWEGSIKQMNKLN